MTFEDLFEKIHGYPPFPWQCEAARRLSAGEPLSAVSVPTASGKTAMIDAAVHAAAHGGARRIVFIIDRRVVVDEAYDRALKIQDALVSDNSLSDFARRLGPMQVVRLRGGVHGDDDWVLYPEHLTVILSTVDQVGSRLLHRGYGVSPRMQPMHAGFIGNDALYIIDEAHLSNPFVETAISAKQQGADIRLVTMTATPVRDSGAALELSREDRNNPVLKKRFLASKPAHLETVAGSKAGFVKRAVELAREIADSASVVGIVVNRVNTARQIHQALIRSKEQSELLIGRTRPYDRDLLMKRLMPVIRAGRVRKERQRLFIVATQTIEVGADIDFDGIVTEAAPLDALQQRFGRVDRLGEIGITRNAILYGYSGTPPPKDPPPDPIYGTSIHETWEWLQQMAEDGCVDFGITAISEKMIQGALLVRIAENSPILLPAHIELLSQTGPEAPHVDISSWLHGAESISADVSLIWRTDLLPESPDKWPDTVCLRPPLSRESLEVPVYVARSWLEGRQEQDLSDLEGISAASVGDQPSNRPVLRWRGPDDCLVIFSSEIRPGDTILLPSSYGGCDQYGWFPQHKENTWDIADYCSLENKRQHVVRLADGLIGWLGRHEALVKEAVKEVVSSETTVDPETGVDTSRIREAHDHLRKLIGKVDHPLVNALQEGFQIEIYPQGVALRGKILNEIDATINSGIQVALDRHLKGVSQYAQRLASEHPEAKAIATAARLHDLGKKEYRFQVMLHGNPLSAARGPDLAKSGIRNLSQIRAAHRESGIPKGFRHELASLSFAPDELWDNQLALYLVATHHGYGRPWFPFCKDPDAPGSQHIPLGNSLPELFSDLIDTHGPWKLAGMELLVRAADARQSIAEREEQDA